MNFALISKIAAAVLGVGLIATAAAVFVPAPFDSPSIWIDQPVAGSTIASGPTVIAVHASHEQVKSFRFVIRTGGTTVKVLNDTSVTVENKDRSGGYGRLVTGAVQWDAAPGVYTIEPRYIAGGEWVKGTKSTVTVLETPPPDAVTPTALPTAGPTNEPIDAPTAEPTDSPTSAPTQAPAPPDEPDAPAQLPTGKIQRSTIDSSGYTSSFYVENITPEFVDVDVQVRTKSEYSSQWDTWVSLGCSDLKKEIWSTPAQSFFGCEVKDYTFWFSSQERQAQVRVVITNYDDESLVYTASGPSWTIIRTIG